MTRKRSCEISLATNEMPEPEQQLQDQIAFLLDQYRNGSIKSIHDLMKLIDMAYSDFMYFNANEKEKYYDANESE